MEISEINKRPENPYFDDSLLDYMTSLMWDEESIGSLTPSTL